MKFKDLSKDRQETILDDYREINTDYGWFDGELEHIAEEIKDKTDLDVSYEDICFDFFSKGNSGVWIDADRLTGSFMDKYNDLEDIDICNPFGVWAYIGLRRDDTDVDIDFEEDEEDEDLTKLLKDKDYEDRRDLIKCDLDTVLDIFYDGYNSLYKSYNYLTSDEGIIETFEANEMEFEDE